MNRHELYEEIQKLEKETGFTLAITDHKKFKENKKRLDKLQKISKSSNKVKPHFVTPSQNKQQMILDIIRTFRFTLYNDKTGKTIVRKSKGQTRLIALGYLAEKLKFSASYTVLNAEQA